MKSSLYAQSYASIAHCFVEFITQYQKLQQRYERQLEQNYRRSSLHEDSDSLSTEREPSKRIVEDSRTVHL